jgi:hypothetical protein
MGKNPCVWTIVIILFVFAGCMSTPGPESQKSTASKTTITTEKEAHAGFPVGVLTGEQREELRQAFLKMDNHAKATPPPQETSIETLARYLVKPARNDFEKARALFSWIAYTIDYDTGSYFGGSNAVTTSEDLLIHRKSVCQGYANLFASLAEAAGLEAHVISGYAKGYGYSVRRRLDFSRTDHAWNAVKLDGKYFLLDSTWGAGYVDDNRQFVRRYEDFYFLTPPDRFIYQHLPEDPKWQMLSRPVSQRAYERMPNLRPSFFKHTLALDSHPEGRIEADGTVSIDLNCPPETLLTVRLEKENTALPDTFVFMQRREETVTIEAVFPSAGSYTLQVFAKQDGDERNYDFAFDYTIAVKKPASDGTGFPRAYSTFFKYCYLFSPLEGSLMAGKTYNFKIAAETAADAALVIDKEWYFLDKKGDIFSKQITIPAGKKAGIYAKFPGQTNYSGLLVYAIEP